ncbi:hypothetical protein DID76_00780 [Candidatus Marinamargulisbacteria bacterium SCGC AG-414-C22]|nr:hypothetical protein DID76_00780 [Candidatus Marinamargulisbacteria bacterium SCGC AG-414-C22]
MTIKKEQKPTICVVFPIYKEKTIDVLINKSLQYKKNHPDYHFIFVDDACPYSAVHHNAIKQAGFTLLVHHKNKGKGAAVKTGVRYAVTTACDYIVFMDADLSVSLEQLPQLVKPLRNGYDMSFGSRRHPESIINVSQHPTRQYSGVLFNIFCQLLLFRGVKDSQCGFKGFSKKAATVLFNRLSTQRFCFDVELFIIGFKEKLHIKRVPVKWENDFNSSVSFFKDSITMFMQLVRLKVMFCIWWPINIKTNSLTLE